LTELNAKDRKAGVFQLDLPLSPLKPGFYTCQMLPARLDSLGSRCWFVPRRQLSAPHSNDYHKI